MTHDRLPTPLPDNDGSGGEKGREPAPTPSYPHISMARSPLEEFGPILVRCPVELLAASLPPDVPYDPRVYTSPVLGLPIVHLDEADQPHVLLGDEYIRCSALRGQDEITVEFLGKRGRKEALVTTLLQEAIARHRPPSELGKLAARTFLAVGARTHEELVREVGLGDLLTLDLATLASIEASCGEHLRTGTLQEGHAVTLSALNFIEPARHLAKEAAECGWRVEDLQTLVMHRAPIWERVPIRRFWHRWLSHAKWWQEFHLEDAGDPGVAP